MHDRLTMAESSEVWLTPLGIELVEVLLQSPVEFNKISDESDVVTDRDA